MPVDTHGPMHAEVPEWSDLSDAELRTRLMHRGIEPVLAKGWVQERETSKAIRLINETMGTPQPEEQTTTQAGPPSSPQDGAQS